MREPTIVARSCYKCNAEYLTHVIERRGGFYYERTVCPRCHESTAQNAQARLDRWLTSLRAATIARRSGRACAWCGEGIPVERHGNALYCSRGCFYRAHWAATKFHYVNGLKVSGPAPIVTKVCELERCGRTFGTTVAKQRFCTETCEQRARKIITLAKLRAATRERLGDDKPCDMCGRQFTPKTGKQRWCSTKCRLKAYEERRGVLIEPRARRMA